MAKKAKKSSGKVKPAKKAVISAAPEAAAAKPVKKAATRKAVPKKAAGKSASRKVNLKKAGLVKAAAPKKVAAKKAAPKKVAAKKGAPKKAAPAAAPVRAEASPTGNRAALFSRADRVKKPAGSSLSLGGDKTQGAYFVSAGRAHVRLLTSERVFILASLSSGDTFYYGDTAGLGSGQIDLLSIDGLDAQFVQAKKADALAKKDSQVANALLDLQNACAQSYISRLRDLALGTTDYRLARFLYEQVPAAGRSSRKMVSVQLDVSREEIAALIGTVREVVSRGLSKLVADGVIRKQGRNFSVLKMAELARRSTLK